MINRNNYYDSYYYFNYHYDDGSSRAVNEYSPEGLALHILLCQSMVGESLIPCRVSGVSQGLCAQLCGL